MSPRTLSLVTLTAAVGAGVIAGVFFAFSTFVMPALARLPPAHGISAMQAINVTAINRWLMGALFGTAAASLVLVVSARVTWAEAGSQLRLGGGVVYLLGAVLVTIACNVPRNEALATLLPQGADAVEAWHRYLGGWSAWNHVRTVASLVAAVLFTVAHSTAPRLHAP